MLLLFFPVNCQETVPNTVNFVGHYRQISATNYDAFLQEIGIPGFKRSIAAKLIVEITITRPSASPENSYTVRSKTSFTDTTNTFTSGVEFEEERPDGTRIRSVITIEGNRWTQLQKSSPPVTVVRDFYTKGMVITMTANGVSAVKKLKRVKE